MDGKHPKALVCAALGNVIFGFSFMFSRIALSHSTPFVMLMYRFDATFLLMGLMILCLRRRGERPAGTGIDWLRFNLKGRGILPLLGLGLIQPVGYFLCESYGIRLTNATFSGVVIALVPIAAIAGSALTLREIPKITQIAFSLLSIAGVILMTLTQREAGQIRPLGVALLLGAVVTGAYFNVLSRKASARYSVLERTFVMMGVAAFSFTLLAVIEARGDWAALFEPARHAEFLGAIGYLSALSSIVAFMALNYANNDLPVAKSTAFANLTTMISLFAGVIFLGEPVSGLSVLASIMILLGIWGSQRA